VIKKRKNQIQKKDGLVAGSRGRPKTNDPKIKVDLRLNLSTIIKIEQLADKMKIKKSELLRKIIEKELDF